MPPSLPGNPPSPTVLHTPERTPTAAPALEELPQTDGTSARTFPAAIDGISVRVSLAAQSWPTFVHGFQEKPPCTVSARRRICWLYPPRGSPDTFGPSGPARGKLKHRASFHGRRRLCRNAATDIIPIYTITLSS